MSDLPKAKVVEPSAPEQTGTTEGQLSAAKLAALKAAPGTAVLIGTFREQPGTYLVGGAVRDLLLGVESLDLDVMVEGDAGLAAERLSAEVGGQVRRHDRFLTAGFDSADGSLHVDFASARTESYPRPGALPDVAPASARDDLKRRDFTINAMAVALWGDQLGATIEFPGAAADLRNGVLRVTHHASFIDDPTRLLRLLRYGVRLGFSAEPVTERLAREAVAAGAPMTVSGSRTREELLDLLAERAAVVGVEALAELGLDRAIHPQLAADEYVVSRAIREGVVGLRQELLLLALCSRTMNPDQLDSWLGHLQLGRDDADLVRRAVVEGPTLMDRVAAADDPAALDALLRQIGVETIVFALALPGKEDAARNVCREWLRATRERGL
jgi:tRNA nucleotidyltransferase (CCA-adding enzyme)